MKNKKLTTYQMAVTALMAAALCVLGPLSVPIGAIPISLSNFVICLTVWLLGPKFGTLSVAVYLLIGLVGVPVFSGYGAGIAKLAGPTGGYLVGYLLLAFIGGLFIEKSKGQPVISGIGLCWAMPPATCWHRMVRVPDAVRAGLCAFGVRVPVHCAGPRQDRGELHRGCTAAQASGTGWRAEAEGGLTGKAKGRLQTQPPFFVCDPLFLHSQGSQPSRP